MADGIGTVSSSFLMVVRPFRSPEAEVLIFSDAAIVPDPTDEQLAQTTVAACQVRRRIVDAVKERGWELVPHNWAQNDILTYYAHEPDAERAVIRRVLDDAQDADQVLDMCGFQKFQTAVLHERDMAS